MEIYSQLDELLKAPEPAVVTIGNFDGFHLGHKHLISLVKQSAARENAKSVVLTFSPHPLEVLNPSLEFQYLQTRHDLIENLQNAGIDKLLILPFDEKLSQIEAKDFLQSFLLNPFKLKELVVGSDFALGKARKGNISFLKQQAEANNFNLNSVEKTKLAEQDISSSRIRRALQQAKLFEAKQLLGRDYSLSGLVKKGQARGKTIGVPTANLDIDCALALKIGVYVTQTKYQNRLYRSVTNVGINPTFLTQEDPFNIKVETHLLTDGLADFYGSAIKVVFLKFLREEKKFPGPKQLIEQIHKDKQQAVLYFNKHVEVDPNLSE